VRSSVAATCSLLLLSGCGMWDSARNTAADKLFDAQTSVGSASYTDRCVDFMRKAYTSADIRVTGQHVTITSNTAVADVQGTRNGAASAKTPRDVAVQCQFDRGVIVGFHWTETPLP
jgi:hypothetical protein